MPPLHTRPATRRETGFSVIEIVVVLLIVAVLSTAVIGMRRSAITAAGVTTTRATARAYEQVARRFMGDHGGRAATEQAPDWAADAARGPIDRATGRTYLSRVPEASQGADPQVRIVVGPGGTTTRRGEVAYDQGPGPRDWRVVARWDGRVVCASGTPDARALLTPAPREC